MMHPVESSSDSPPPRTEAESALPAVRRRRKAPGTVTLTSLARRYPAALRRFLGQGQRASRKPANRLGRRAVVLGLEPLDVARIHEQSLRRLTAGGAADPRRNRTILRAGRRFFAEVIGPIEGTHRIARVLQDELRRLGRTLDRRTVDLADSRRRLRRGIRGRRTAEDTLRKRLERFRRLLRGSLDRQKGSRRLTRDVLAAQESGRRRISRDLHDEIAQSLLGINVRLITLKRESAANVSRLQDEFARTRRQVRDSADFVRRFARRMGVRHET